MNEYTEFDTAAEMQKALDRKKAAYGVPYAPLLETTVVDADGIIRDTVRVTRTSGELHTLCTYQHNLAVTCEECTGSHPSGGSRVGVAYKQFIEQEAIDRDPVNSLISTMALGWVITLLCGVAIGYYIGAREAAQMVLGGLQ